MRRILFPKALYLLSTTRRPLSAHYGTERGTPIDRYYVDRFIERRADDLRGRALEVGAAHYLSRFGGPAVTSVDVLDIDPGNDRATVLGDLRSLGDVPDAAYDCVILVQVLLFTDDVVAATAEAARILRPGGVLLATVPGMAPMDPEAPPGVESWRFTANSLRFLLRPHFGDENLTIETHGNVRVGIGIWVGMAQEDFRASQLDHVDPRFPCVITARAVKPKPS